MAPECCCRHADSCTMRVTQTFRRWELRSVAFRTALAVTCLNRCSKLSEDGAMKSTFMPDGLAAVNCER
jgi:hypothetical protein